MSRHLRNYLLTMKILILGGTRFLGRHLVEAALSAGHEVTLFNRGLSAPGLYPGVEQLRGDRDGGVGILAGRNWDAVVDTCGYLPRVVRQSADVLRHSNRYLFISSVSVYRDASRPGLAEDAPVAELVDPTNEDIPANYGALKAACEQIVLRVFAERALVVRPGLIVGPHGPDQPVLVLGQALRARGPGSVARCAGLPGSVHRCA